MSLKTNVVYSTLLTLSTYLVPLVVYPYISRVLGPAGIGAVDTVDGFINYAVLFSMMGLTTIGTREIAKSRDSAEGLSRTFSSLFSLNLISTGVVLAVLAFMICYGAQFKERWELMIIGMVKVLFNLFWVEWFFKGMENFRYITLRSICMRLLFVIVVFLLIREEDDYVLYYILWVSLTVGNAVCNWIYRRRFVRFSFARLQLGAYVKPFLMLGLFALFSAIYTQLNVVILGFSCGAEQAGYYTMATKIYTVLMALFSSLTVVMIPRMAVLVKERGDTEIRRLVGMVFQLLFLFAFPIVFFTEIFAPEIIYVIGGEGFQEAVLPMRIVMPLVFVIGSEQIFMMQVLVPLRKDRMVFVNALAGAVICVLVNLFLLHEWQSVGSACAWVAAELTVFSLASCQAWKSIRIGFPLKAFLRHALWSLPYGLLGGMVMLGTESWIRLPLAVVLYGLYALFLEEKVFRLGLLAQLWGVVRK